MKWPAYPTYKPSGIDWLGDVPDHWEVKRLKYSASLNDEALPETTDPAYEIFYVDISSVDAIKGIVAVEELVFEDAPSRARRIVRDGDTIVSTVRTYLRAIAPLSKPKPGTIVSTGFAVVRPRKVAAGFLSYAFRESGLVEAIVARSVGVSYPAVNASEIGCLPIPLPCDEEQYAIADFLDRETAKIDTLVAKKKTLIERLREKRTALISRTVTRGLPPDAARAAGFDPHPKLKSSGIDWLGDVPEHWDVVRIGHIADKVGSGKTPRGGSQIYQSDGVLLIRSQNVHDTGLRLADAVFIDESIDEDMASTRVEPGDVLLNITGASLGRSCIVQRNLPPANVNQHVCIIRIRPSAANPQFVQRAISAPALQEQIFSFENGSSREGLTFQQVRGLLFGVPPVAEQRAIADFLDRETGKIDGMIAKVEIAIERLQEYRSVLITAAVTGKIDVREAVA